VKQAVFLLPIPFLIVTGCDLFGPTENRIPVISSVTAEPQQVERGGTSLLNCVATDLDGDELAFEWDCSESGGSFTGDTVSATGTDVEWTAPLIPGDFHISVTVSDADASVSDGVTITVLGPPTAIFVVQPTVGSLETIFSFDATSSYDAETPAADLEVRWDWEDDGTFDTDWTTTKTAQHQYDIAGTKIIRLEVRDEHALIDDATRVVIVIGGGTGELIEIPGGVFVMGQEGVATPEHEVTLNHNFQLGRHEVTNQQFLEAVQWAYDTGLVTVDDDAVWAYGEELLALNSPNSEFIFEGEVFSLRTAPNDFAQQAYPEGYIPGFHPVLEVSWYGTACFCDWLSLMEDLDPFYTGEWDQSEQHDPYATAAYRLPTEAEWEYAASYDDERTYPWGETTPDCDYANYRYESYCVGWTAPAGNYPAGAGQLGLMDMAGNLREWVGDRYAPYDSLAVTDPLGPATGDYRVSRGGDWGSSTEFLPCAKRVSTLPGIMSGDLGFRICRTANP